MNVNVDWDASVIFMTAFKSKGSLTVKGFLSNDLIKKKKLSANVRSLVF